MSPCKIKGPVFKEIPQCQLGFGEFGSEPNRLERIRVSLVKDLANRCSGRELRGVACIHPGPRRDRERIVRVQTDRLCVCGNRGLEVFGFRSRVVRFYGSQIRIERRGIARPAAFDLCGCVAEQRDLKSTRHGVRDIGLQRQNITQVTIVGLRPEMEARHCAVELRGDANLISRAPHAPFQDRRHVQLVAHSGNVRMFALKRERRSARGDLQLINSSQRVQQLFREPVGEILLIRIPTHIDERQHRDGMRRRIERGCWTGGCGAKVGKSRCSRWRLLLVTELGNQPQNAAGNHQQHNQNRPVPQTDTVVDDFATVKWTGCQLSGVSFAGIRWSCRLLATARSADGRAGSGACATISTGATSRYPRRTTLAM